MKKYFKQKNRSLNRNHHLGDGPLACGEGHSTEDNCESKKSAEKRSGNFVCCFDISFDGFDCDIYHFY